MSRLLTFTKKHRVPLLSFTTSLLLLLLSYAVFGISPFGERSILVLDLAGQYVYFFEALRDALLGEGSLLYSFARPLGGEFLGMIAYYLASPFSLLTLLFPKERITDAVWLMLLLKTGAAGATASLYLKQHAKRLPTALTVSLSVAYALSGFAMAYQSNTMWADAWILLPLVVLGLERLMDRKDFLLYTVTLTLTFITNYYMGYMIAIFCVLYFLYYLFSSPIINKQKIINNATHFILFSILSAFIASFMLFPAAYSLTLGKSDFTIPGARDPLLASLPEILKKLLPATYDTVMSDGTPFLYCGIFAVLLLPFYFLTKSISKRQRIANGALLSVLLLSMTIEPLDRIWHGFSAPNGLPCRFAFLFVFLLLRLAAITLQAPRKREKKQLLLPLSVAFGALLLTVILLWRFDAQLQASTAFLPVAVIALLLTTAALALVLLYGRRARLFSALLALVILCEIGSNAVYTLYALHEDVTFTTQAVFEEKNNALLAAADRLEALDGGFYRTEATDHLKANDTMYSGLRGLSGSSSTLHAASISFLSSIGIPARWHRSLYNSVNPLTDALLGVKYVFSDRDVPFYSAVFEESGLAAFQNTQALSLAYGVQGTEFSASVNAALNCNRWLSAMTGNDVQVFSPLASEKALIGGCKPYLSENDVLVYLPNSADSVAFVTMTAIAADDGALFFSLPAAVTSPVYLYVNNQYFGIHFDTSCSYLIYLGQFCAGEEVSVRMVMADNDRPLQLYNGEKHFFSYDATAATAALQQLAATQLLIDEASRDDRISGSIQTVAQSQTVLLTVPFDGNWRVYVDGKQVEINKAFDALISFHIEEPGTHTVVLEYRTPQLLFGAAISLLGIAALIGICLLERKKRFFKQNIT